MLLSALIVAPGLVAAKPAAAQEGMAARRSPVVRVVEKVQPAVVNIAARSIVQVPRRNRFDALLWELWGMGPAVREAQSLGSGVLVAPDGLVVTNEHVVEGASQIRVTLVDGRSHDAEVVGSDVQNDLALLRLKEVPAGTALPYLEPIRANDLMVGETVVAIGNPFGLESTVTSGVVSALNRTVTASGSHRTYTDFIQTDASINPGNSGGALVDITGRLVGINTAIVEAAQGIGFAIPGPRVARVVDDLRQFGHVRPLWLGMVTRPVAATGRGALAEGENQGLLVRRVLPGSPADQAGLAPGDLMLALGRRPLTVPAQLRTALATMTPGGHLTLTVLGGSGRREVTLAPQPPPADLGEKLLTDWLGLSVADSRRGVVVRTVRPAGPAADTGLEPGDRLLAVGGQRVDSVADLDQRLALDPDPSSLLLVVGRGGYAYNLTFPLDE